VLEEAWLGGEVGEAQVGLVVRARTPATEESLARDQDMLVDHARRLRFASFARVMAYWVQWADPDGAEDEAAAAHASRRLHLSQGFGGRWVLDGILDPIGGSILDAELRRIDAELFAADWDEAKARMGEGVCVTRPGPHPGPAPGRRRGGDGPALGHRPRRRAPSRAPLHRAGGLRGVPQGL